MKRPSALVFALAGLLLVLAACGDGSGSRDETVTPAASASASAGSQADLPQPTPRAPADDEVALIVVSGESTYQPTVAEFNSLPTLPAADGRPEGVALGVIASQVGADADAVVTIEGRSIDFGAVRFWRGTLPEAAETMVLTLDEDGRARLAGSLIPEQAWIYAVESIAFE